MQYVVRKLQQNIMIICNNNSSYCQELATWLNAKSVSYGSYVTYMYSYKRNKLDGLLSAFFFSVISSINRHVRSYPTLLLNFKSPSSILKPCGNSSGNPWHNLTLFILSVREGWQWCFYLKGKFSSGTEF